LVVDVGANVGVFSVFASRAARLVYSLVCKLPRLVPNVSGVEKIVPLHLACAGQDGPAILDLTSDLVSFSLKTTALQPKQETVEAMCLGTLFERYRISHCDFLKLDCEGSEFDIILDSKPSIFKRISRIVMEYHDHLSEKFSHNDLLERLERLGYHARAYSPNGKLGMISAIRG
jgi:FkbM family methyltransferase